MTRDILKIIFTLYLFRALVEASFWKHAHWGEVFDYLVVVMMSSWMLWV